MDFFCSALKTLYTIIEYATSEHVSPHTGGQRTGAFLLRLLHGILADHPHKAWLFVDDLLATLHRSNPLEQLALIVVFFASISAPISWKKMQLQNDITWCGWSINFGRETIIQLTLQKNPETQRSGRIKRKLLEQVLGLLLLALARRRKERAYPNLAGLLAAAWLSSLWRLEGGGARKRHPFLGRALARTKAREVPARLRVSVTRSLVAQWSALLAPAMTALASSGWARPLQCGRGAAQHPACQPLASRLPCR